MNVASLGAELIDLERDLTLDAEINLSARAKALDFVELIGAVARGCPNGPTMTLLARRANALKDRLARVDARLVARVRSLVRQVTLCQLPRSDLRAQLDRFTDYSPDQAGRPHLGFDGLDVLVDALIAPTQPASEIEPPHPEMVHYEPTPARVVLDLVDHARLKPEDVFIDLGSGLGRVAILVSLLAGIRVMGIEYQEKLCAAAKEDAAKLGVGEVAYICADARDADYSDGTIFYLFTPFKGGMLRTVLDRLRAESQKRPIAVCTYGSCTRRVVDEPWLRLDDPEMNHDYKLAIFRNRR